MENKNKEIIEGLRQRVETLIEAIQEYTKKLKLEEEKNGSKE